jgi:hypothetical protein
MAVEVIGVRQSGAAKRNVVPVTWTLPDAEKMSKAGD